MKLSVSLIQRISKEDDLANIASMEIPDPSQTFPPTQKFANIARKKNKKNTSVFLALSVSPVVGPTETMTCGGFKGNERYQVPGHAGPEKNPSRSSSSSTTRLSDSLAPQIKKKSRKKFSLFCLPAQKKEEPK